MVVLVHGSGGMGPNIEMWARELNAIGISTFALDGFTGRGLVSVNMDQARLGRLAFTLDAYRALEILAKHPRVDASRIVLMGFSRGGQGDAVRKPETLSPAVEQVGRGLRRLHPVLSGLLDELHRGHRGRRKPIRIFHGTPDDYNPVASCKRYIERLKAAGRDIQITEYPNAQHGFDNPLGAAAPTMVKGAQTVRACQIAEEPKGVLINASRSSRSPTRTRASRTTRT